MTLARISSAYSFIRLEYITKSIGQRRDFEQFLLKNYASSFPVADAFQSASSKPAAKKTSEPNKRPSAPRSCRLVQSPPRTPRSPISAGGQRVYAMFLRASSLLHIKSCLQHLLLCQGARRRAQRDNPRRLVFCSHGTGYRQALAPESPPHEEGRHDAVSTT